MRSGRWIILAVVLSSLVATSGVTASGDDVADYGADWLKLPPAKRVNSTSPRTIELLTVAFNEADPADQARIADEIGSCELPEGIPVLRTALGSEQAVVRAAACRAAAAMGRIELLDDLIRRVADPEATVRREAVLAAFRLSRAAAPAAGNTSDAVTVAIGRALEDADGTVVIAALQVANSNHAIRIARGLAAWTGRTRLAALDALSRIGSPEQAGAAAALLDNADVPLRAAVARALGGMKAAAHSELVVKLLGDPHPSVRRWAVWALHGVVDVSARQQRGLAMLGDADPTVRESAARLLQKNPLPEMAVALAAQLATDYRPLHAAAREALWNRGDGQLYENDAIREACIAAAVALLNQESPLRHIDGAVVLGQWRSNAGLDRMMQIVKLGETPTREPLLAAAETARAIGLIGDRRAAPSLLPLLDRRRSIDPALIGELGQCAEQALVALGRLRYKEALPRIQPLWQVNKANEQATVRAAAIWAWGAMGEATPQFVSRMGAIYRDMEDAGEPKLEGVKAVGNLRASGAVSLLETVYRDEPEPMRYFAWRGLQRIAGKSEVYVPADDVWQAPTSIRVMTNP